MNFLLKIKNYLFIKRALREKRRSLWASQLDLNYLEGHKKKLLDPKYQDTARSLLRREAEKENPDVELINNLTLEIGETKGAIDAHFKTQTLLRDLPKYIEDIEKLLISRRIIEFIKAKIAHLKKNKFNKIWK